MDVLKKIQEFLGCGKIYPNRGRKKRKDAVHKLCITSKKDVEKVLLNLQKYSISKQNKISYILKNYSFGRNNDGSFNLEEFHSMTERRNVEKYYAKREVPLKEVATPNTFI